jgi:Predicted NTPase (NACHT family)
MTLLLLPITVNLATSVIPDWIRRWQWLYWIALLMTALVMLFRGGTRRRYDEPSAHGWRYIDDTGLDEAGRALASAVSAQWAEEAAIRGLHRIGQLRVRWSTAVGSLAPDPAAVLGDESLAGRAVRLRAHGEVRDMAVQYRRLKNRQLVVLGAPGSGKTVLALLLTRALAERSEPGEPTPVLLSLSRWRPDVENLQDWLIRQLEEEYPFLTNVDHFGPEAAARLVATKRILPILDGLDELPVALHRAAVEALDVGSAERPFVVTSRTEQYRVAAAPGHLLSRAMVIVLEPLAPNDIEQYLAPTQTDRARWGHVLASMRTHPDGPLAAVFARALMVSFARSIYGVSGSDPRELLRVDRFPDPASIEKFLLDRFTATVYATPRLGAPGGAPSTRNHAVRYRWLAYLAMSGPQFAWWRLYLTMPAWAFTLLAGGTCSLIAGPVVGVVAGLVFGARFLPIAGVAVGVGVGAGTALVTRWEQRLSPARIQLRFTGRLSEIRRALSTGLGAGTIAGALFGLTFWLVGNDAEVLAGGMTAGLVAGLAGGLGVGAVSAFQEPIDEQHVSALARCCWRTEHIRSCEQVSLAS